jgi:hypothetical protein
LLGDDDETLFFAFPVAAASDVVSYTFLH